MAAGYQLHARAGCNQKRAKKDRLIVTVTRAQLQSSLRRLETFDRLSYVTDIILNEPKERACLAHVVFLPNVCGKLARGCVDRHRKTRLRLHQVPHKAQRLAGPGFTTGERANATR